ncbi:hypothetical protein Tsubulata_031897 [Turnera subulata]|uniref:Uncharacterized protein n=1 Tax=Turnera subulata TaxID=218843 RepID=A0A9Q0GJK7_9ROSI|nr:hypothetical protein Tsubulata_031897 [Turnera subulata]
MSAAGPAAPPLAPASVPPPAKPPDPPSLHDDAEFIDAETDADSIDGVSAWAGAELPTKPSFLETLLRNQQRAKEKSTMVDLIQENMVQLQFIDGDKLRPSFALDATYYQRLCDPWKDTLILRLLGAMARPGSLSHGAAVIPGFSPGV